MESVTVKDKIGLLSVIAISTTGIIGSGWLFSAYLGAKVAGAAVYVSWTLTLVFFILMSLVISEIVSIFPVRGIIGRMGALSHNKYFGAIFAFAIWLELIGSIPGEAQASVEYLANVSPWLSKLLISNGALTTEGIGFTILFLVAFWMANLFGIKFFTRINNSIAVIKVFLPAIIALIIMGASFHPANFTAYEGSFMPYGYNSIVLAMTSTGMLYSFNGFQLCASFASEIKNPGRNLPLGMVISIVLCFLIYVILQTSFIGALDTAQLANHGWLKLDFTSPFAQLATLVGLNFLTIVLYVDACISPSGTGITFVGSGSRVLSSMAAERQMPQFFAVLDKKHNFEKRAIIFNFGVALIFLFLFHSWAVLINFITALIILMYMVVPITLIALRHSHAETVRSYKLPFAFLICCSLFVIQAIFFIFIGAKDMQYLTITMTVLIGVFLTINAHGNDGYSFMDIVKLSVPFLAFLWAITILILVGPLSYGGNDYLSYGVFYPLYIAVSVYAFYFFTNKKFVAKCQAIRHLDNAKISGQK
jgi:amino acid transporter